MSEAVPDHVSTTLTTPASVRWCTDVVVNGDASFPSTKRVARSAAGTVARVEDVDWRGEVVEVGGAIVVVVDVVVVVEEVVVVGVLVVVVELVEVVGACAAW